MFGSSQESNKSNDINFYIGVDMEKIFLASNVDTYIQ